MSKKTKKIKDLRGTFFTHENCKRHLKSGTNENYNWYLYYNIQELIKEKEKFIQNLEEDKLRLVELEDKLKLPENWWFKHKNVYLDIDDLTVEIECQEIDLKIIEQEISKRYYEQNNS